jgi:HEAT repeat protein
MRLRLLAALALLCTLPARGDNPQLAPHALDALTQLDTLPSEAALSDALGLPPDQAVVPLAELARNADGTVDLGVQLRAIHALPAFCPPAPAVCGLPHDTLIQIINAAQAPQHTREDVLRLRTAIEALGATRSGLDSDVAELLPLLRDDSRDVRATVARALPNLCNAQAAGPLMMRYHVEPVAQVQLEILSALDVLDGPCAQ